MLKLENEDATAAAITDLRNQENPTNWLLFGYVPGRRGIVELVKTGESGLSGLAQELPAKGVNYAVFEVVASSSEGGRATCYDASKYIFLTWIGPDTPAGIAKARSSTDGPALTEVLNKYMAIGAVTTAVSADDLTYENMASKVLSLSATYTGASAAKRTEGSVATNGMARKRTGTLDFDNTCREGLETVERGEARWALLGYSGKTSITLEATGKGSVEEEVAPRFEEDKVKYCVVTVEYVPEGCSQKNVKTIVMTMVGERVSPLTKSRSAGQRDEVLDFVLSVMPYHFHYQPLDKSEVTEEELLRKCK